MSEETAKYDIPLSDMSPAKFPALSPGWRIANFIMAIFFFLAAIANANDNDWYIWTPIYLFASILCFVVVINSTAVGNQLWQTFMSIQFGVSIVLGVYQVSLLFGVSHKMAANPFIQEEGREMGGLIIILAWTGISRFSPFGSSTPPKNSRHSSPSRLMAGLLAVALTLAIVPLLTWSLCFVGDWHRHLAHCSGMFK